MSGGPDSVALLHRILADLPDGAPRPLLIHFNHRLRGASSDEDQRFVESLGRELGLPVAVGQAQAAGDLAASGVEAAARAQRYAFIRKTCSAKGIRRVLVAHTADDQVETILMRFFEGAGITGLKGIPLTAEGGIERPLIDVWRSEILSGLADSGVAYRTDESNLDIRFERNWIRHVLLPLLVERYGEEVKRRIHKLGDRFRELDSFICASATRWIRRNAIGDPPAFKRGNYARLPSVVRIAILQQMVLQHAGKSPNERLLQRIDRSLASGGPSSEIRVDRRFVFRNRYETASLFCTDGRNVAAPAQLPSEITIETGPGGRIRLAGSMKPAVDASLVTPRTGAARLRRIIAGNDRESAIFDAEKLAFPLRLSALAAGDRIVPFGGTGSRKAKEIMIDLKIPRECRWGRAAIRDAGDRILWIPGVVRSNLAPVDGSTRHLLCLTASGLC
ncbi:MAG TPA: tRNA lysidine(34) synthetase TilS [Candidatus Deferrimicrobiaceae bacterium]